MIGQFGGCGAENTGIWAWRHSPLGLVRLRTKRLRETEETLHQHHLHHRHELVNALVKDLPDQCPTLSCWISGMSSPSRDVSPQVYKQSVRSCRACHQRKIRCDRGMPCNNCSRYRIACVYPTKSSDVARKSPSLQTISSRLERLEVLLSRLTDSPQSSAGTTPVYSGSGSQPQIQIQARPSANVNTIGITNQQPSEKRPSKLTWELLLNDEPAVQAEDTSNIESLPQNVSLGFSSSLNFTFALQTHHIRNTQANIQHVTGREYHTYPIDRL